MNETIRKKKKRRRKVSTRLLIGVVVYALINMLFISVSVGFYYLTASVNESKEGAFAMTRTGTHMIDGDRVLDYLEIVGTDENSKPIYYRDEYYDEVMEYLNAIQLENKLVLYYYVFVTDSDQMVMIWDADTAVEPSAQGDRLDLTEADLVAIELAMQKEPEEKVVLDDDPEFGDLLSAYSPIFNSAGEPVALVGVDLSVDDLVHKLAIYLFLIVMAILIVTVISVFILYRIIRRIVVRPIQKLNDASKSIMGELTGNARFDLEIHSNDEMEELADSFRKMDADLHEYLGKLTTVTVDRERIHAELNIAKRIQGDLLPNDFPAFPERNDFDIYATLYPAKQIGGDFYDFFLIDDDHLAMVVGDVAGEGVPAALYMVIVETLIKSRAMQKFSPAGVLQSVSEQLLSYKMDLFSFVWLAVLELSTGKGIAINAGHEHPILRRAGKRFELQTYHHSIPIGAVEGVRYHDHGFQLEPGDCIFLYSDGVKEAPNEKGEPFSRQRVLDALNREPEATPSILIQTVKQAIDRYTDSDAQGDDLTMLCLKYYGSEHPSDMPI